MERIKTKNKSIIDLAQVYVDSSNLSINIIPPINHVRIYKKIYLPCELVGFCGQKKTKEFREGFEESSICWRIKFIKVSKPLLKSMEIWQRFIDWLSQQGITIINNFDNQIDCRYQITRDNRHMKENKEGGMYYERTISYSQEVYKPMTQVNKQE